MTENKRIPKAICAVFMSLCIVLVAILTNTPAMAATDKYYNKYGISEEDLFKYYAEYLARENDIEFFYNSRGNIIQYCNKDTKKIWFAVKCIFNDTISTVINEWGYRLNLTTSEEQKAYEAAILEIMDIVKKDKSLFVEYLEDITQDIDKYITSIPADVLDLATDESIVSFATELSKKTNIKDADIVYCIKTLQNDTKLLDKLGKVVTVADYVCQIAAIDSASRKVLQHIVDLAETSESSTLKAAANRLLSLHDSNVLTRATSLYLNQDAIPTLVGKMLSLNPYVQAATLCIDAVDFTLSILNQSADIGDIEKVNGCVTLAMITRDELFFIYTKTDITQDDIMNHRLNYAICKASLTNGYEIAKNLLSKSADKKKCTTAIEELSKSCNYDKYIESCIKSVCKDIDSGKIEALHIPPVPETPDTNDEDTYEKALFPMKNLRVSQGINNNYSHINRLALDICGADSGIEDLYAPFDCVVKRTYGDDHVVWIESTTPVVYADGSKDYMTIMLMHDNDISDLYVGKEIKKGEIFYQEGTAGNATANHVHIECGRGKFSGTGWYRNSAGKWCINNGVNPFDALSLSNDTTIYNGFGYNWRRASEVVGSGTSGGVVSTTPECVDLGDNFYAYIIKTNAWTHLTVHTDDYNVTADALTGAHPQIWHFTRTENNNYLIQSLETGEYLSTNGAATSGSNVCTSSDKLEWIITGESANYRLIPFTAQSMALDIDNNSDASGANAQIFYYNNTMAQKFQIWYLSSPANTEQSECYIDYIPTRNLYYDSPVMTGNDVKWLQNCLSALGFETTVDGSYGPLTKSAVREFQAAYGLEADGMAGPATQAKLKELLLPQGNTLTAENTDVTIGSFAKITAHSTNDINIRNYNFHVINPDETYDYYFRGTDNEFVFYPSHGTGQYIVFCTMNNDCGTYEDESNICTINVTHNISDAYVALYDLSFDYTGEEISPTFNVIMDGEILSPLTDYTYEYVDNVAAGKPSIVITGINDYSGVLVDSFEIKRIPHTELTYSCVDPTYSESGTMPEVTVTHGDTTLVENREYILTVTNDLTTMTGKVTVELIGNYSGETVLNYTIEPRSINEATVADIAAQAYTGSAIKPSVSVTSGDVTLTNGTDYTVTYSNNQNVGTASVTITGKGRYTGTKTVYFNIVPAAPVITSATANGTTVTLKWNAVSGATSYRIYRASSATGGKTLIKTVGITSCTDTTVSKGNTYYYFVQAYNSSAALLSSYSAAKSVSIAASLNTPTISSVTQAKGKVNISWKAVDGATSYKVYRATSATGTKSLLKTVGITSCTDTTAVLGNTYYYFVQAYSSKLAVSSDYSGYKSLKFTSIAPPTLNSVTANGNTVTLSWSAVPNATSYRIYRGTSATGAKSLLKTVGITSCNDTTVSAGNTYYYFVAAYSSKTGSLSAGSATKSVAIENSLAAPVITNATEADGVVSLSWNAVSGATSYKVYRATSATGTKTLLKTVGITSCNDTTAQAGTTYYYFVQAYSSKTATSSAYSASKKLTTASDSLAAPVISSVTVSGTTVTLKWSAVDSATSYRVYRATSATGTKTLLKTVGITSCNDTSVSAGDICYYFVAAYNSATGELSDYSNYKAAII